MKKFLGVFSVVSLVFVSGCGGGSDDPSIDRPVDSSDETTSPDAQPGENEILAILPQFSPTSLEVAVGTEVTFTNRDAVSHTATAGTSDVPTLAFDFKLDADGGSGTHKFDEAGTFPFHCAIHNSMSGTVTVA